MAINVASFTDLVRDGLYDSLTTDYGAIELGASGTITISNGTFAQGGGGVAGGFYQVPTQISATPEATPEAPARSWEETRFSGLDI